MPTRSFVPLALSERGSLLIPHNDLLPSFSSIAEIYEGVIYSSDPHGSEAALRDLLVGVDVISIDDEICRVFTTERGRLRSAGNLVGDFDLLIGATAIRHDLTLPTNNRRHRPHSPVPPRLRRP